MQRVTETQNQVVITDRMWARLLSSTNQPSFLSSEDIMESKRKEEESSSHSLGSVNCNDDCMEAGKEGHMH